MPADDVSGPRQQLPALSWIVPALSGRAVPKSRDPAVVSRGPNSGIVNNKVEALEWSSRPRGKPRPIDRAGQVN